MIRVLIAADSALVRMGLESLAAASAGIEIVGAAASLASLLPLVEERQPDVCLAILSGREAALPRELADVAAAGSPAVLAIVEEPRPGWVAMALEAGVRGILPPDVSAAELGAAMEAAAAGLVVLHPRDIDAAAVELRPAERRPDPSGASAALSPREIEVLRLLADGMGNKEIAWQLGISDHTVKFHVASILNKLDAATRTEAVTIGIRQGLILL